MRQFFLNWRIFQVNPFLVKYIDFIEVAAPAQENQYFLVLELLEGMPEAGLSYRIRREGKLEPAEAIPLFLNYLEALAFLHGHARPLIHRDIKPTNLYAPAGQPEKAKVFDLGVARDVSGTVTSGGVPGTLDYMAPEFARPGAGRGTPQSDIYSLGLCFYEALVGQTALPRLPAEINSSWPIFQERARTGVTIDYQARVFRMYPDLMAVVQKAIAHQPDGRYAGAAAMRQDLEKVLLRLDRPEEVPPPDDLSTVALSAALAPPAGPAEKKLPTVVSESVRPAAEDVREPLPELPDDAVTVDAGAATRLRRRRSLRAAAALLILLAAGAGAAWWNVIRGGWRPAPVPIATPVPPPPITPVVPPVVPEPPPVIPEPPPVIPEQPPVAPPPAEPPGLSAAREELKTLDHSVRIPLADPAYLEKLAAAAARARNLGGKYPELADEAEEQAQEMEQHGRAVPALFQSGLALALAQKDVRRATDLLADWRSVRRQAALMGLTDEQADAQAAALESSLSRYQLGVAVAEAARGLPPQMTNDREVAQAEQAAEALETLAGRQWPGIAPAELGAKLAGLRLALTDILQAGLVGWQDAAVFGYQGGEDGAASHAALEEFADKAPEALALVNDDYRLALKTVGAARANWEYRQRMRWLVLQAITHGASEVDQAALAAVPVDPDQVRATMAAVRRVRGGFDPLALFDAAAPGQVFLAAAADCWKKAALCEGPLAEAIRAAAWTAIHDQLLAQGAVLLKPQEMMAAGVRTPEQQARVRREYLRLLAQIEAVTGRLAACPADDPLRLQIHQYFRRPYFHRALLDSPAFADPIPWLAAEFRNAQNEP